MRGLICCMCMFLFLTTAYATDDLQGKITAIDIEGGTIEVSGVKIIAKSAKIENLNDMKCTPAALKVGDSVEVDGIFSGPAEMTATKIEQEGVVQDKIEGILEAVDCAARTLMISGILVKVPAGTFLEGKHDLPIKLEELTVGTRIECEGTWTGSRELTVGKIEVD